MYNELKNHKYKIVIDYNEYQYNDDIRRPGRMYQHDLLHGDFIGDFVYNVFVGYDDVGVYWFSFVCVGYNVYCTFCEYCCVLMKYQSMLPELVANTFHKQIKHTKWTTESLTYRTQTDIFFDNRIVNTLSSIMLCCNTSKIIMNQL